MNDNTKQLYYEIAVESIANRNHIIEKESLEKYIKQSIKKKTELYHSVYQYDDNIINHFKDHDSVRSYRGYFKIDKIIFDIDRAKSTDDWVLDKAKECVSNLIDVWQLCIENIHIWYSGTGYHIYIDNYFGDIQERSIFKNTISKYFGKWSDVTLYGGAPLIRAPYSLNLKSGLYKIQLSYDELFNSTAQQIMKLAESNTPRSMGKLIKGDYDWSDKIEINPVIKDNPAITKNILTNQTNIIMCAQTIYDNGEPPANRHNHLMRLVSVLRGRGITEKMILDAVLSGWNKTLQKTEVIRVVKDIYQRAYNYGCNDAILSSYCDPKCVFYKKKNLSLEIKSVEEIVDGLVQHIEKTINGSYIDLKSVFNLKESYRIYDGELVIFYGDTKLNKSMIVSNIMAAFPNKRFLSMPLENRVNLETRRLLQMTNEMDRQQVEDAITNGEDIYDDIRHISFYDEAIHIDSLGQLLSNPNIDIVVIDTADQLQTKSEDYTAKTTEIAIKLREYTNKYNKTIIAVHHINRNSAEDDKGKSKKLTVHSGKGSSAIEQKADKVIGIEGDRNGSIRVITSLAARDEAPFESMMYINKKTCKLEIPNGRS